MVLSIASVSSKSFAQQKELELDPVTVTATLTPVTASNTGRNILVIRGEQFNKLPVHSIDELLRYLPGLEVQARGPMGSQSDILVRGGTYQQVLVIMDGIRLNDPLTGHFNAYIPISVAEIDRIEVLKGASSAIYGTEAVGAVIQIISKTFNAKQHTAKQKISGEVAAGQYGLFSGNAGGFFQKNNTAFSAGIISNHARGQEQRGTRGFFDNSTFSASVKQWLSRQWSLSFRTAYDNRDFAAQNFYTSFSSDTATEKVSSWWNHLKFNYETGKNKFSLDAGYKQTRDFYLFSKSATANENKSKILQALATYDHSFSESTVLTSGIQLQQKSIRSNDRGNHNVDYAGGFIILNWKWLDALHINPAVRFDWNSRAGWDIIPQLNLSYRYKKFQFRASAGKTTRDADFTERYNNYNKVYVSSGSIGNPDLESERSFSFEGGVDFISSNSFKISSTYFNKQYSKLIDFVLTPYADMPRKDNLDPAGNYLLAKNIASVRTEGFETDIQFNKNIGNNQSLYTTVGLVWMTSKSDGTTPSLYISSHADFICNFNFSYRYKIFQLGANGLYKRRPAQNSGSALVPLSRDYFVMNMRLDAFVWKNKIALYLQADNIFDRTYADRFGVPMPGSWWMGGIKFGL
jgi:iron complex outermembrane receptor protein